MGGGEGATVIPLGEIGGALDGLLAHIRMTQKAAKWLGKEGYHAASVYFSILCLEEISKYHVISGCRGEGRGVLRKDMEAVAAHRKRLCKFWDSTVSCLCTSAGSGKRRGRGIPAGKDVGAALSRVKEMAVYFEFADGGADTLEGRLGAQRLTEMSGLLKSLAAQGIQVMWSRASAGGGPQRVQHLDPRADMCADMSRVMEIASMPERVAYGKDDVVIPLGHLDPVLDALWDHIAILDKIAHMLYRKKHDSASIFLSIISLEESAKYYLLAKSRRQRKDVLGSDLRALKTHKTKLSVFFKDVSNFLGDRNRTADPSTYVVVHPKAFLKLNGLKELAIYFNYAHGGTMTLRALFDRATGNFSRYLRMTVQGLSSWMIMCDGDHENPYRRHNRNAAHYGRYKMLEEFMKNRREVEGMYYVIGQLDCLNSALRRHDPRACKKALAELKKHIRP